MKKRKNRKQEDKFRYLLGRKVHRIIFFCNLKHKKNHHIHKVTYGIFIMKHIYNGFFCITTSKFSPFIKSVLGPKFNMFVSSTTTLVDIFQFSLVNIRHTLSTRNWQSEVGGALQSIIATSDWEQGDQSQEPLVDVRTSKSSTSKQTSRL